MPCSKKRLRRKLKRERFKEKVMIIKIIKQVNSFKRELEEFLQEKPLKE